MTAWQSTWEVTRWEFRRFLKPKQLLISLVSTFVLGALGVAAFRFIDRSNDQPVELALIGGERLGLGADTIGGRLVLQPRAAAEEGALRAAVAERELDGLLVLRDSGPAELVVRRDPGWRGTLAGALTSAAHQRRLAESGMDPARLQALLAPVELDVQRPAGGRGGRGEIIFTFVVIGLSFTGLMTGMGFIFAGITGEKQQRVTEQVVSIIPPQTWIDGKILGLAGVAAVNTLVTGFAFGALFYVFAVNTGRMAISLDMERPLLVPLIVLVSLLGFFLWFAFLGAVAATIDDPHTSQKGSLLMMPMLPVFIAFMLVSRAEGTAAQFFALFPFTAPTVLPVRMILAEPPAWEVPLSFAILIATTWLLRRAAGKIFATGILMYGKEPTLREMWRWAREA